MIIHRDSDLGTQPSHSAGAGHETDDDANNDGDDDTDWLLPALSTVTT